MRLPELRGTVEIYDSGFHCGPRRWEDYAAAARRDESRNTLVADLALGHVEQHPTMLLAETVEQIPILERYTGDGVAIHELPSEDVLDEAHVAVHTAPLVLATYLTTSSGWWDVSHWGAIVLGSPLGCEWQTEKFLQWLLRPAPRKETAVLIDIEDRHPAAYHRLCRRISVYTRRQMPWRRIA